MSSSLNDDLEYLQNPARTEVQRWAWLAAQLDTLKERTGRDFLRINGHEKRIDGLEEKETEGRWLKRLTWTALAAAAASWAERLCR